MNINNFNFDNVCISEPVFDNNKNIYVSDIMYNTKNMNCVSFLIQDPNIIKNSNNILHIEIEDENIYQFIYKLEDAILKYITNNSENIFGTELDRESTENMLIRSFHIPLTLNNNPYMKIYNTIAYDNNCNYDITLGIDRLEFYRTKFYINLVIKDAPKPVLTQLQVPILQPMNKLQTDNTEYQDTSEPDDLSFDIDDDDASVILTECFINNK